MAGGEVALRFLTVLITLVQGGGYLLMIKSTAGAVDPALSAYHASYFSEIL